MYIPNLQLFDRIRGEYPGILSKLVPVNGDITQPGLGLSPEDEQMLIDKVSVVFHAAATVKFDEALKMSVNMNVHGTKRLVSLCHKMNKLAVSFFPPLLLFWKESCVTVIGDGSGAEGMPRTGKAQK